MNDMIRYMVTGFAALAVFCLLFYLEPYSILFALLAMFVAIMSLAVGYIIVDTYDRWREDNDKNQSRKTPSSSKNDKSNTQV
jgi:positive regulator of sigma E activity